MAMVPVSAAFWDSAFGCQWYLVFRVVLKVEQATLSILCVFAISLFYSTEEGYVGHDFQ